MKAVDFMGRNRILTGPGCEDLPVNIDGDSVIAVFEFTPEEIESLSKMRTPRIVIQRSCPDLPLTGQVGTICPFIPDEMAWTKPRD